MPSEAPNYRPTADFRTSCGACSSFDAMSGLCSRFKMPTTADMVCDAFTPVELNVAKIANSSGGIPKPPKPPAKLKPMFNGLGKYGPAQLGTVSTTPGQLGSASVLSSQPLTPGPVDPTKRPPRNILGQSMLPMNKMALYSDIQEALVSRLFDRILFQKDAAGIPFRSWGRSLLSGLDRATTPATSTPLPAHTWRQMIAPTAAERAQGFGFQRGMADWVGGRSAPATPAPAAAPAPAPAAAPAVAPAGRPARGGASAFQRNTVAPVASPPAAPASAPTATPGFGRRVWNGLGSAYNRVMTGAANWIDPLESMRGGLSNRIARIGGQNSRWGAGLATAFDLGTYTPLLAARALSGQLPSGYSFRLAGNPNTPAGFRLAPLVGPLVMSQLDRSQSATSHALAGPSSSPLNLLPYVREIFDPSSATRDGSVWDRISHVFRRSMTPNSGIGGPGRAIADLGRAYGAAPPFAHAVWNADFSRPLEYMQEHWPGAWEQIENVAGRLGRDVVNAPGDAIASVTGRSRTDDSRVVNPEYADAARRLATVARPLAHGFSGAMRNTLGPWFPGVGDALAGGADIIGDLASVPAALELMRRAPSSPTSTPAPSGSAGPFTATGSDMVAGAAGGAATTTPSSWPTWLVRGGLGLGGLALISYLLSGGEGSALLPLLAAAGLGAGAYGIHNMTNGDWSQALQPELWQRVLGMSGAGGASGGPSTTTPPAAVGPVLTGMLPSGTSPAAAGQLASDLRRAVNNYGGFFSGRVVNTIVSELSSNPAAAQIVRSLTPARIPALAAELGVDPARMIQLLQEVQGRLAGM